LGLREGRCSPSAVARGGVVGAEELTGGRP
jgi:hypothetical protein